MPAGECGGFVCMLVVLMVVVCMCVCLWGPRMVEVGVGPLQELERQHAVELAGLDNLLLSFSAGNGCGVRWAAGMR